MNEQIRGKSLTHTFKIPSPPWTEEAYRWISQNTIQAHVPQDCSIGIEFEKDGRPAGSFEARGLGEFALTLNEGMKIAGMKFESNGIESPVMSLDSLLTDHN